MRNHQRGFTYLMLLWWVAISGVLLAALGQRWAIEARRQREIELVFRGEQIKAALVSYRDATPGSVKLLPSSIDDLLDDRRRGSSRHHLRRAWDDPITGEPWGLIKEGPYILGVFSRSVQKPLRAPESVETYADWRFEVPAQPPAVLVPLIRGR